MFFFGKKNDGGEKSYAAGMALCNGRADHAAAFTHFSRAAQQGHVDALLQLGFAYFKGLGTEENEAKAIEYYNLASDKGSADAAFNLSVMAMNGQGMPVNLLLARQWALLAKQRGNPRAAQSLVIINFGLETERMEAAAREGAALGWRLGLAGR